MNIQIVGILTIGLNGSPDEPRTDRPSVQGAARSVAGVADLAERLPGRTLSPTSTVTVEFISIELRRRC